MKKNLIRKGIVFFILIIFIGTCVFSTIGAEIKNNNFYSELLIELNGKTFYVGGSGPGNYTTIQGAIDNASEEDIVFVYSDSSPYFENIVIDKSIRLIGENPEKTIIIGNYLDCTIYVNSSYVYIFGFTIINGDLSGIKLWRSKYSSIINNIIRNNKRYGISLIESCNNSIAHNDIENNDNGIKLSSESNSNILEKNDIINNYNGIYLEYSSENILISNWIQNNENGIKIYYKSRGNLIKSNFIIQNSLGIFLGGTITPTFAFNILLDGSTKNIITKNNFIENTKDAFFQNSRRNRWWNNYWHDPRQLPRLLPKLIFGEQFICRLQGIPPTAIEHHIPWIPRIDWRPALFPFYI